MSVDEAILWERLARSRRAPLQPSWLEESYSSSLSADLRQALCEKLGSLAANGWPIIMRLMQQHGEQKELVLAAGLCHQREARDWLLHRLNEPSHLDDETSVHAIRWWTVAQSTLRAVQRSNSDVLTPSWATLRWYASQRSLRFTRALPFDEAKLTPGVLPAGGSSSAALHWSLLVVGTRARHWTRPLLHG